MASTDSAAATPTGTPAPTPRYVPGAPPPAPPSKSKKKKAKSALKNLAAAAHEAALSDHAPDAEDVKAGKVDPSLLANPPPPSSGGQDTGNNTDADDAKAPEDKSVVAESIAKRVRALGKKAQRLQEYKNQKEELNPDQKAALEGLPLLESNIKELEGIKKTVETLEAGQRRALAQQRNEERKAAERRVSEANQHAEASLLPRITSLLSFLALRNLLTHATPTDLTITDGERNAIISAGDALLAYPPVGHVEEIVKGFLTGAGSWEDTEYSRLLEITSQFAAPRAATPIPDPSIPLDPTTSTHPEAEPEEEEPEPEAEPEVEPEAEVEQPEEAPETEQPVVLAFGAPPATGGGFHFMQESELDVPATMTESQEWVSVQQHEGAQEEEEEEVAPEEDVGYVGTEEGATAGADAAGGAPLDWAAAGDEHDELPDIGGLQATFGGSGSATPIAPQVTSTGAPTTGKSVTIDDDGFTAIPSRRGGHGQRGSYGGRGRGGPRGEGFRGRGGFRGEGGEGGYRGRGRGSWQGGEGGEGGEGGYRGRGGYRGGEGGEGGYRGRGGYRSEGGEGGEGGYRGRGRGSWQGGEGGEGAEGGYRGRGGYRGGEGGEGGYRGRGGYRNDGGEGEGGYRGRGRGSWSGEGGEGRGGRGGYRGERRGSGFRGGRGGSGGATPTAEAPGAA